MPHGIAMVIFEGADVRGRANFLHSHGAAGCYPTVLIGIVSVVLRGVFTQVQRCRCTQPRAVSGRFEETIYSDA